MNLQVTSQDKRIVLKAGPRRATLYMEGRNVGGFDVVTHDNVTANVARKLTEAASPDTLVVYELASPEARDILRKAGTSYAGRNGALYLHRPPIHVELPGRGGVSSADSSPFARSPFAPRASRVARWLLLHTDAEPSLREISIQTALSESLVSRTARALADERLIEVEVDPRDSRSRRVHVRDSGTLLDTFERGTRRRTRGSTWDIGARDPDRALSRLRRTAKKGRFSYAIGGLAGAAMVRRVVEPAEVDLWVHRDDHRRWIEELDAIPARPGPGRIALRALPDPYVLAFSTEREGLSIADPVQLYVDCRRAGERALEAAEAIRLEMGW